MNPLWGPVAGVLIVLMMLTFIGIWIWAWLPHHKRDFSAMAHLPMQDEDGPQGSGVGAGEQR